MGEKWWRMLLSAINIAIDLMIKRINLNHFMLIPAITVKYI